MAYLVMSSLGSPMIFRGIPVRVGTKKITHVTESGRSMVLEIPVWSNRKTFVPDRIVKGEDPGCTTGKEYSGNPEDYSTWSIPYALEEVTSGILIEPETAEKIYPGLSWETEPIEI